MRATSRSSSRQRDHVRYLRGDVFVAGAREDARARDQESAHAHRSAGHVAVQGVPRRRASRSSWRSSTRNADDDRRGAAAPEATVNKFSEFARLPQVQLADVDLVEVTRAPAQGDLPSSAEAARLRGALRRRSGSARAPRRDAVPPGAREHRPQRRRGESGAPRALHAHASRRQSTNVSVRIANDGVPVPRRRSPRACSIRTSRPRAARTTWAWGSPS